MMHKIDTRNIRPGDVVLCYTSFLDRRFDDDLNCEYAMTFSVKPPFTDYVKHEALLILRVLGRRAFESYFETSLGGRSFENKTYVVLKRE